MNMVSDQAIFLQQSIPAALNSSELNLEQAEQLLSFCVRYLAGVERLHDAIAIAFEAETINEDMEGSASEVADECQNVGLALQNDVFDKIRELGGNANALLAALQAKYFPD